MIVSLRRLRRLDGLTWNGRDVITTQNWPWDEIDGCKDIWLRVLHGLMGGKGFLEFGMGCLLEKTFF